MKKALIALIVLAVVVIGAMFLFDADVTDSGSLPEVDINATGGSLPEVDVETPDVDVNMQEKTIEVPNVDVDVPDDMPEVPEVDVETETETIEVPSDVDVK